MTPTEELNKWIAEEGKGSVRDALDVALARLAAATARAEKWRETAESQEVAFGEAQAELARVRAALRKIDGVVIELAKNAGDEVTQQNILLVTSIAAIRVLVAEALAAPPSQPVAQHLLVSIQEALNSGDGVYRP